jgi:PPOX class probable F420-dependent enzyme
METKLPARAVELLRKPVLAHIATVMRDGSPQVTPVWVDTDGDYILVNTAEGRVKTRNLKRNHHVALSITDPTSPLASSLIVRGTVVEIITEGADEHISFLARKYTGAERHSNRRAEVRVILRIRPDSVSGGVTQN